MERPFGYSSGATSFLYNNRMPQNQAGCTKYLHFSYIFCHPLPNSIEIVGPCISKANRIPTPNPNFSLILKRDSVLTGSMPYYSYRKIVRKKKEPCQFQEKDASRIRSPRNSPDPPPETPMPEKVVGRRHFLWPDRQSWEPRPWPSGTGELLRKCESSFWMRLYRFDPKCVPTKRSSN